MKARHREWIKTIIVAACVLAYFAYFAGWKWTLGFVVLCAVAWYFGYYRPLTRAVKQAKRRTP